MFLFCCIRQNGGMSGFFQDFVHVHLFSRHVHETTCKLYGLKTMFLLRFIISFGFDIWCFILFANNRLPFLMVLLWVVVEVFQFLEHFALQLIEQYANIFFQICFSSYLCVEPIFSILLYLMIVWSQVFFCVCYNTTIFRFLQLQKCILDSTLTLQPHFTCHI